VPAKPAKDHKLVGQPAQRIDIPDKVMGRPIFIQDLRLPGMVLWARGPAVELQCGALRAGRCGGAQNAGVLSVVRDGRFLGVVAEREEQAIAAREALAKARVGARRGLARSANVHEFLKTRPTSTPRR
jgi:hypothetical protein